MPRRSGLVISKRTVDALRAEEKDVTFWDRELPGFGVRVYPSGSRFYLVQCRGPAGIRRASLGCHGDITPEQARKKAVAAIARIREGEEPAAKRAPRALTVAQLAERYLEGHVKVHCNAHTQRIYAGSLRNHILPAFGAKTVVSVGRAEVAAFHYGLRETPRAANRALMVLSKIFSLAEAWGQAPGEGNPCRFVLKYKEGRRERFLTDDEYRRVGRALCELEAEGPVPARAVAALRLLMLTGCRSAEILTLRWSDVDRKAEELRLRDAKTGARMVPLTPAALEVLAGIKRVRRSPWVIAGNTPDRHLASLTYHWHRVRERAEVEDVRIHDLRHSFASRALALGLPLPMIGRLLGHTDVSSTARYAHLSQDAEKVAAARVGDSIEDDILRLEAAASADGGDAAASPAGEPAQA
ncbi:MAG: site-specific integrase [Deltaproteobacteria bacterium]|nr:site-specific integrase [Deltaproteobacteria bacterium]